MRGLLFAAMTVLVASPTLAEPVPGPGAWLVDDKVSALDGTHDYTATVASDDKVGNIIDTTEKAHLAILCGRDSFALMIDWPDFIDRGYDGSQLNVSVKLKLDDGPIQTTSWSAGEQAVMQLGDKGEAWVRKLSAGKVLVVRVPDKHGGQEATFQISGLDRIIANIDQTVCG